MRLLVYSDGDGVDLALPGDVPVGALWPAVHDLLTGLGLRPDAAMRLSRPGHGLLDLSMSLQQNGIRDGDLLTLESAGAAARASVLVDAAVIDTAVVDAAAAVAELAEPWPDPAADVRRAGAGLAVVMAALVGVLVVPGGTGLPEALLGAAAAAAAAALSIRALGPAVGVVVASWCALVAAAATVGTLIGLDITDTAVVLLGLSLALLASSARVAVRASGVAVAGGRELPFRAAAAHRTAGALVAGSAAGTASGVLVSAGCASGWAPCALGAAAAGLLLLRIRAQPAPLPAVSLLSCGTICLTTVLMALDRHLGWAVPTVIATVVGVAAVGLICVGERAVSPRLLRRLGVLELGFFVAVAPLGAWAVGAFDAVPW